MAPVFSRHFYPKPEVPPPAGWVEGGNFTGDYHVWVEDLSGRVLSDCMDFAEYGSVCDIRGCDLDRPCYAEWPNQPFWLDKKVWSNKNLRPWHKHILTRAVADGAPITAKAVKTAPRLLDYTGPSELVMALGAEEKPISYYYNTPDCKMCPMNASALYYTLQSKGIKCLLVVGSMGWLRKNSDTAWWEFG